MEVKLNETAHPNSSSQLAYDSLIAIDEQKKGLLNTLSLLTNSDKAQAWHKKHHKERLLFFDRIMRGLPLIILSGDVGCGKTELANAVATPLAKLLDRRIKCFETPSNIRGAGRVGEISNRITMAFDAIKSQLGKSEPGILIIDEADDLATSREQNQAHHEDRAGLNVLLKQIDSIARDGYSIVVLLITNRLSVIDPAIIRRATRTILFTRPDEDQRTKVFEHVFKGIDLSKNDVSDLVKASAPRSGVPFSFSDLIQKAGRQAIYSAIHLDEPLSKVRYIEELNSINPSPIIN